jgi:iron complex transport system substrate-binding protein
MTPHTLIRPLLTLFTLLLTTLVHAGNAPVTVKDASGNTVTLQAPAKRIVTLAAHATELVFAAGAGDALLAVSAYSDFPAAAKKLPQVAAAGRVDLEAIVRLKPDLIISWRSGYPEQIYAKLRALGIPIFLSDPQRLASIGDEIEALGALAGTSAAAKVSAAAVRQRTAALQTRYANASQVPVFHQIWSHPVMTVNGKHIISDALRICGARNVFDTAPTLTPTVAAESVIAARPALISTAATPGQEDGLAFWRSLGKNTPRFLVLDADRFSRATPRMLDEVETLCAAVDAARKGN